MPFPTSQTSVDENLFAHLTREKNNAATAHKRLRIKVEKAQKNKDVKKSKGEGEGEDEDEDEKEDQGADDLRKMELHLNDLKKIRDEAFDRWIKAKLRGSGVDERGARSKVDNQAPRSVESRPETEPEVVEMIKHGEGEVGPSQKTRGVLPHSNNDSDSGLSSIKTSPSPPASPAPPVSKRRRLKPPSLEPPSVPTPSRPSRRCQFGSTLIPIIETTVNGPCPREILIKTEGIDEVNQKAVLRRDMASMRDWAELVDSSPSATRYIAFYNSVEELAEARRDKGQTRPVLQVVRGAVKPSSLEDAVKLTGRTMESEMAWDDGSFAAKRPTHSIGKALALPHRLKCLAIKDLPENTYTLEAQLGYDHALNLVDKIGQMSPLTSEEQIISKIAVKRLLGVYENPSNAWFKAYQAVQPATAVQIKEYFRIASCWAIINAEGSFTPEHHDAAGSATHFVVHAGIKVWFVKTPGGTVEIAYLFPGDAAVMAPGTKHCVYTLEASVCIGGHGWAREDIPMMHAALLEEHKSGSNETIPLWYPILTCFGIELAENASERIQLTEDDSETETQDAPTQQLAQLREIALACLETPFARLSGKPPAKTVKVGETIADYGRRDIAAVLKYCEVAAARAVKGLRNVKGLGG